MATKGLLKTRDVLELLNISRVTLWRLIKRQEIKPIRLRGMMRGNRFTQDELDAYLARSRRATRGA